MNNLPQNRQKIKQGHIQNLENFFTIIEKMPDDVRQVGQQRWITLKRLSASARMSFLQYIQANISDKGDAMRASKNEDTGLMKRETLKALVKVVLREKNKIKKNV